MPDPCLSHAHLDGGDGQGRPVTLGCARPDPHRLHYDEDHGIWWADAGEIDGMDEAAVRADAERRKYRADLDLMHSDLGDLLEAAGLGNYARPLPPHDVMQQAIARVRELKAERQELLDDGDQTWAEATRAERDRIWSRPVTQRLELHDGPYGPVWRCAGCLAELTESTITHMPRCSEMRGAS